MYEVTISDEDEDLIPELCNKLTIPARYLLSY